MQGIRINGAFAASKKALKEAVATVQADNPASPLSTGARIRLVATSVFGNEFDGFITEAPVGTYFFVGPDENRRRNFYGKLTIKLAYGQRIYKVE